MDFALIAWAASTSVAWIVGAVAGLVALGRLRSLSESGGDSPESWPSVTVVIAARDEERKIGGAVASLRTQDYPRLEILVADDRSTDGTGALLERIATEDPRVRVIRVRALPEGWLGKVHALHVASEAASGDWVLFTDADVHFRSGSLRRAVACAVSRGLDHLVVAPDIRARSALQQATNAAFAAAFVLGTRAFDVSRPGSDAYVGVGGFNLVRHAVWAKTPGFASLRMEVLDDLGLAKLMRDAGARRDFVFGLREASVDWYPSLGAMIRGLEKNLFAAVARFSVFRAALLVVATAALVAGPAAAAALGPSWLRVLAGGALAALGIAGSKLASRFERPVAPFLLMPLGALVLACALARSAWVCVRQGGIVWRDTFYPLAELREGRMIDL